MKSKRKSFIVLMVMVFVLGIMGTVYAATDGTTTLPAAIKESTITGVEAPAYTAIPVITATETAKYTATVTWSPDDNPFAANTVYTAIITLTPKTGYTLTGVPENYFKVPGATTVTNAANSGVITAVFPATAADLLTIKERTIAGVSAPAYTATPVTTATETADYTAAVTWSPDDNPFAANKTYTATITLTPKAGYTLTGVTENYFEVPGATTVTNDANSGVITAVFPATAADLLTIKERTITGVSAPTYTATPVTTAAETADYTAAVTWSPDDNPFVANKIYTATITLTPKAGYTLTGVPENYFKVPGATTVTNAANSGVITAIFSVTATDHKTIKGRAITGVKVPAYKATPVTTATETGKYTASVTWSPDDNPFVANKVYTATITLTPKAGYTLTGVPENYFKVPGATTVTNDADSGVITAVFPATGTVVPKDKHKGQHDKGHKGQNEGEQQD